MLSQSAMTWLHMARAQRKWWTISRCRCQRGVTPSWECGRRLSVVFVHSSGGIGQDCRTSHWFGPRYRWMEWGRWMCWSLTCGADGRELKTRSEENAQVFFFSTTSFCQLMIPLLLHWQEKMKLTHHPCSVPADCGHQMTPRPHFELSGRP